MQLAFTVSNELSILFVAASLLLHSDGVRGVARIDGSSKGRCEMPSSNYEEKISTKMVIDLLYSMNSMEMLIFQL